MIYLFSAYLYFKIQKENPLFLFLPIKATVVNVDDEETTRRKTK